MNELHYFTGQPCKYGHIAKRLKSDRSCTECNRIKANLKYRSDPEQAAAKMREYRANETVEIRKKRLEKAKLKQREWRAKNPNHTGAKEAKKQWKRDNPGKVRADTVKRRTAKIKRTPAWLSADELWLIEQAYDLAALRTKMFGFSWHVDHVLPLQGKFVSGLHVPENLQVIPGVLNVVKANKYKPA